MRWTRQRLACDEVAGRVGERPVSDQQHADERCLQRTAKSCGPDTPTLVSSLRMLCRPYRARMQRQSANDGGKRARSPGRARRKPLKPLRAGTSGDSGVLVVTRVRSTTIIAHETAGALGIRRSPRPLWAKIHQRLGRMARRGREFASGSAVFARSGSDQAIHAFVAARWIASRNLSSGAFARPRWLADTALSN